MITILSDATKTGIDKKISLKVSRLLLNPACMAGVLISGPNFSALWVCFAKIESV